MSAYDDWNRIEGDDDDELQDMSLFEGKRDVILFAIDCSESMHQLREHPEEESVQVSNFQVALDAAMKIQKRKVHVGPNDAVGIMLFNTKRSNEGTGQNTEIKKGAHLFQSIATINPQNVLEIRQLIDAAQEDPNFLRESYPPLEGKHVAIGNVFTSCNWIMRDGAPKTATKRVFFITDDDDPHPGVTNERLKTSAQTTLKDLREAGITVEPFFISTEDKPFDPDKFYNSVLSSTSSLDDEEESEGILPDSISITRVGELLDQMIYREVPKRAVFSIPFELAEDFSIGIKGYALVVEQKKGNSKWFADLGDTVEPAASRTVYIDQVRQAVVEKSKTLYGMGLGEVTGTKGVVEEGETGEGLARVVSENARVFYTAEEVRTFRTLGLEPKVKLLGFKNRKALAFEDNIKHSYFIYPDEMKYSGSKRTFSALLRTMINKKKIGLVMSTFRRNAAPLFCALVPQAEKVQEGGWNEPAGFHLIPFPFADDIRAFPDGIYTDKDPFKRASDELKDLARKWIDKLTFKGASGYEPDSYPNPGLSYHYAQIEALALRDEPPQAEDRTKPNVEMIHKRAGSLMQEWKEAVFTDASFTDTVEAGGKRKADLDDANTRGIYEDGQLGKLKVDQLKNVCRSKGLPVSGKKDDLIRRIEEYFGTHPQVEVGRKLKKAK